MQKTHRSSATFVIGWIVFACLQPVGARAVVSEDSKPEPEWIWAVAEAKENQVAYFRKSFEVPAGLLKAILLGACDRRMTVFVNGTRAAEIEGYATPASVDIGHYLRSGTNVIAVQAVNDTGPAAFSLLLELALPNGRQQWIATDRSWLASLRESKDWLLPAFTPTGWGRAFSHGKGEVKPWGNPFDPKKAFDSYNSWKLALSTNTATDPSTVTAPAGFKVERVRSASPEEGSWVSMAFDPKGRLTIAREKRGLLRMTFHDGRTGKVELIDDTLLECRGLLYAFDALYVNANNSKGFYRLRDRDGDGQFDETKLLLQTEGGVGHGRNQLVLGPDEMIYVVHGNDVHLTERVAADSPHRHYAEDQLIPCSWDDHSFNSEVRAPGGHILRTDREGSKWTLIAGGFRNPLDAAFNADGEMFTYDADMERDIGAPWYRPTRINHVVSGGEYGWRRGTGKWPAYYADSLPSTHDIGVGSPTGIEFGTASQFPPVYQRALFVCDWAYGRIIAVHLRPNGASYTATSETFVTGRPLNVTDVKFGPDGAMYFITGGRGTQSGLYRVSYVGPKEKEAPKSAADLAQEKQSRELRALRRKLEAYHVQLHPSNSMTILEEVWPHLGHADFWIRYAARIALEQQEPALWQARALEETQTDAALNALMALARVGERTLGRRLLERLNGLALSDLNEEQQLQALRVYALAFIRMGKPDMDSAAASLRKLDSLYPAKSRFVNHELCELLVYLNAPGVIAKTVALLESADNSEDLLQYLFFLRYVRVGWTIEQRRAFFHALSRAEQHQGARDYLSSLKNIRTEVTATLTQSEQKALAPILSAATKPSVRPASSPAPQFVKDWQLEDFDLAEVSRGRSFEGGKAAFGLAQCILCHRMGSAADAGGLIGPDLTAVASRFGRRDLLESILQPSKVIDDKFRNTIFQLKGGSSVSGTIEREDNDKVVIKPDALAEEVVEVPRQNITQQRLSDVSPMPAGLVNILTREHVLDLLAYLESGGRETHPAFRR